METPIASMLCLDKLEKNHHHRDVLLPEVEQCWSLFCFSLESVEKRWYHIHVLQYCIKALLDGLLSKATLTFLDLANIGLLAMATHFFPLVYDPSQERFPHKTKEGLRCKLVSKNSLVVWLPKHLNGCGTSCINTILYQEVPQSLHISCQEGPGNLELCETLPFVSPACF